MFLSYGSKSEDYNPPNTSPIIPPKTSADSEGLKPTQTVKVYFYNPL